MIDLTTPIVPIVPYKGTGIFELDADYSDVIARMQAAGIAFDEEFRKPENIGGGRSAVDDPHHRQPHRARRLKKSIPI